MEVKRGRYPRILHFGPHEPIMADHYSFGSEAVQDWVADEATLIELIDPPPVLFTMKVVNESTITINCGNIRLI